MIQHLVFFGAGLLAGGVITVTLVRHGRRILDALAGHPIRPVQTHSSLRHVWSVPRERLPLATQHAPMFTPVRSRP